jgi:transketolase
MQNHPFADHTVNVIKGLIMDGTRKANSGHPGGAMSSADMAYVLFRSFLKYDPENTDWPNRDRFVLSAGHESMLLYSLLHLQGYLDIDELRRFRQLNSLTPGHPEADLTPGVEATTGPLGQGISMAVGMALAEAHLNAKFGKSLIDHYTWTLVGDGDLQEPVALGSCALAGHFKLAKLIAFYDKNEAQISGHTDRADSTDIKKVYAGLGWQVLEINGHNHHEIEEAIESAKNEKAKPTLIIGHTTMAMGAATREGDHETHGAPLPAEEITATKTKLGLDPEVDFLVTEEAVNDFCSRKKVLTATAKDWYKRLESKLADDTFRKSWDDHFSAVTVNDLPELDLPAEKAIATRSAFGKVLALYAEALPGLMGGSADLEPSNKTDGFYKVTGDFTANNRLGRNIPFGVREFPMGALLNGMTLHGGIQAFGATFLVFSDYEKPALRLSAIQHINVMHVFTHDSFYVGEDGPTHQPVEQLAGLRATPNLHVYRPADAKETQAVMRLALTAKSTPSVLALTRQDLPVFNLSQNDVNANVAKGGYILQDSNGTPELILLASGSEVHLILDVAKKLGDLNIRVVSMPCMELFDSQDATYRESVLPNAVRKRLAVEAAATFGWHKYTGIDGQVFGLDSFGKSAPYKALEEDFGFTTDNLAKVVQAYMAG